MDRLQTNTLHLPSFLHGTYKTIERRAKAEGRRCAKEYQLSGAIPQPRELLPIAPGDVVFTHNVVDFDNNSPAWRLYLLGEATMSFVEADKKNYRYLDELYEKTFRETPWGALYHALSGIAPHSAERTALRLQAVIRSWDSLHHGRYLHKKLNTFMNLEELMTAACGWAMNAWCPEGGDSVRSRFQVASERMARATREECVEALLGQLPRILSFADRRKLNHTEVVMELTSWREHLATLEPQEFERISGVCPADVLREMYQWDRQLDVQ
jgi:hypothetical protein